MTLGHAGSLHILLSSVTELELHLPLWSGCHKLARGGRFTDKFPPNVVGV